ncbi:MAG TPA: class II aldolase/adducin family protein [Armatimonadota bacterium]|nr:class II aldolase/adducin family protein [Armatimonadota bacterium]
MAEATRILPPYPGLGELIGMMGEAGRHLAQIGASEGAAGNISVYVGWPLDPRRKFPVEEVITLPYAVPQLAGGLILVTGSGRRLREVGDDPEANMGAVIIDEDGKTGRLYTSHRRLFARLTSEFNSHLAIHQQQVVKDNLNFHAIIHAQPTHLTYLTHVPGYQDQKFLNQRLLRWQPELIVNLSEGVANLPFCVPGSQELMEANLAAMKDFRVVVWGKHGIMARSNTSVKRACDLIEYAETGARYEYMNMVNGGKAEGLKPEEIKRVCAAFNIKQDIF